MLLFQEQKLLDLKMIYAGLRQHRGKRLAGLRDSALLRTSPSSSFRPIRSLDDCFPAIIWNLRDSALLRPTNQSSSSSSSSSFNKKILDLAVGKSGGEKEEASSKVCRHKSFNIARIHPKTSLEWPWVTRPPPQAKTWAEKCLTAMMTKKVAIAVEKKSRKVMFVIKSGNIPENKRKKHQKCLYLLTR